MKRLLILFLLLMFTLNIQAQDEQVRELMGLIAKGRTDEVKKELPMLQKEYPSAPGVMLLGAVLSDDAHKAFKTYRDIVDKHPDSEWADDSYWRIVQFYAVTGDLVKAREVLEEYTEKHPDSEFLIPAHDIVLMSEQLANKDQPKDTVSSSSSTTGKIEIKVDSSENSEEGPFGLQVSIFKSRSSAEAEMKNYIDKRIETSIIEKKVNGVKMYAVVIGDYSTKEKAEAAKEFIKKVCLCNPLILKK